MSEIKIEEVLGYSYSASPINKEVTREQQSRMFIVTIKGAEEEAPKLATDALKSYVEKDLVIPEKYELGGISIDDEQPTGKDGFIYRIKVDFVPKKSKIIIDKDLHELYGEKNRFHGPARRTSEIFA